MGYRAADLLLAPVDAPVEHVVFAPELVIRASSLVA
jgi:DNA-binding LacI/PurR family transcriptional regulator